MQTMENRIIQDLKHAYGLTFHQITPVSGGWLNQKWKISTDQGEFLVKHFSPERHTREKLHRIEAALQRQILIEKSGIPCPSILPYEGRAIRFLDETPSSFTAYMVMDFLPGQIETPATITSTQMHSLGSACGLMHKAFSKLPTASVEGYPIDIHQIIASLWANFRTRSQEPSSTTPDEYQKAVLAQEPILHELTTDVFDKLPKGIAHEDFAADNILFNPDGLSAIVDFDRNHYSFIWHDIGRAMLSFALKDDRMDIEKIHAFRDGYSQHLPLTLPNIADALRLSWCIETPWWIQPQFFTADREKVTRFRDEILWLTTHWPHLNSLLGL